MADHFDGFGIAHRDTCKRPEWRTINDRRSGQIAQRCQSCGVIWHRGDGQLTPRTATYGKSTR